MSQLKQKRYPKISETLFYRRLDCGLDIYYLPKEGFHESYAILTSQYGSVDKMLTPSVNEKLSGIAHFLEHKLFENEDGSDVLLQFTELGAEANAFTSFDRTTYLVSTTNQLESCLSLLIDFVTSPHFKEKSVQREVGIIEQEIDMYADDADDRLFLGIRQSLYPGTALADDIAGTLDDIRQVTAEILQDHYNSFYQAENLTLITVGNFDVTEIDNLVVNRFTACDSSTILAPRTELDLNPVMSSQSLSMDVAMPKLAVGFRGRGIPFGMSILEYKLSLRLVFSLLFGSTSETYQDWYDSGKIDQAFDIELEVTDRYQFVIVTLDTWEPIAMANRIKQVLINFQENSDVSEEHLNRLKREYLGEFLKGLDSIDTIATQLALNNLDGETYLDFPDYLERINLKVIQETASRFVREMDVSDFTIFPK
ncbi:EF-P 5-aminopentanol modification-associated protein YfmH [Streptococcus saliviloxodontae]|uniref:Zn-dependent peptidase n=1 Tax=Streptococcus saliviloxodontae TaxID=1349416 RepID=A0ABS2PK80_9STRE|nr:pitrilysin family protein [Streptococcus saliviloxodontae]MBM7635835.1 putative Zn-dependent peptidase [Streptococcus saliviloxodontae]